MPKRRALPSRADHPPLHCAGWTTAPLGLDWPTRTVYRVGRRDDASFTSHAAGEALSSGGLRRMRSNSRRNAVAEDKMATSSKMSIPNRVNNAMKSGGDTAEMTFRGRAMRDAAD